MGEWGMRGTQNFIIGFNYRFNRRKGNKGKRMRKNGQQWCFTMLEVTLPSIVNGKKKIRSLEVDIR